MQEFQSQVLALMRGQLAAQLEAQRQAEAQQQAEVDRLIAERRLAAVHMGGADSDWGSEGQDTML